MSRMATLVPPPPTTVEPKPWPTNNPNLRSQNKPMVPMPKILLVLDERRLVELATPVNVPT